MAKGKLSVKLKQFFSGEWCKHGRPYVKSLGSRAIRRSAKQQIKKMINNG